MRYNFDDIIDRRGSGCVKYDDLSAFGNANVIPLWIADMDFEAPEFICQAIARRAAHRVFGYGMRTDAYYAAITNWVERRNGWHIDREWIDFTPGVVAGFVFALRALSAEGDGIVIMPPVYPPFAAQIKANGRRVVENPLIPEKGYYRIDYDDLDRKLAEATVLLFCNPHNPTGRVFTAEELRRVADLCRKHDVAIVSDEIHSDLIFAPCRHTHIASLCAEGQRCITLIAPTKTFNIAGLSTSAAITPDPAAREALRTELGRYHVDQGNIFGTPPTTKAKSGSARCSTTYTATWNSLSGSSQNTFPKSGPPFPKAPTSCGSTCGAWGWDTRNCSVSWPGKPV